MKNIFKIATLFCLAICVMLLMAACNTKDETPQTTTNEETTSPEITTPEITTPEETTATDTSVTYTVTVVDENNAPLAGATVQLCVGELCRLPVFTGADGVAILKLDEADYTVKVTLGGYTGEAEYHFAAGSTELTVQLTKVPEETSEEDLYPEPVKQLLTNNQPYSLEFVSNGDGTCYVSKLYLNNRYETAFDIIIPEQSPTGETVTGIDFGDSLTSPYDVIPKYLTDKQIGGILTPLKANYPNMDGGMVDKWWINAYIEYDISNYSPEMSEKIIESCPVSEYMTIFEFDPRYSHADDTFRRIQLAGITPSVTKQYYAEFIQEARDAGAPEEILAPYKVLMDAMPAYANYSAYVRYLHVPASVSSIDAESLSYLMLADTFGSKKPTKGIVLPKFDPETTRAIAETFSTPKYTFVVFSQSTSSVGYEEIDNFAIYSPEEPESNVLAWHYVDGVPTLW